MNQYLKNYIECDFTQIDFNINILCECLKNGFHHEGHLVPQSEGDYAQLVGYTKITPIKMEDPNFNETILKLLNHNHILSVNNTYGVKYNEVMSDENVAYLKNRFFSRL